MVNLAGFCVFSHGARISLALFVASAIAMIGTGYGAASCRLYSVSFIATKCFGQYFDVYGNLNIQEEAQNCKASVGLYQWLQPLNDSDSATDDKWDDGYCVGYQKTMLDAFSNMIFEAARGFGVFAVLLSFVIIVWTLLFACIQMNFCQVLLFRTCALCEVFATGFTFLFQMSPICTSKGIFGFGATDSGTLGQQQTCRLDPGGYAMIIGCMMWFVTFILSVAWLRPCSQILPSSSSPPSPDEELEGSGSKFGGHMILFGGRQSKANADANIDNNSNADASLTSNVTPPETPLPQAKSSPSREISAKHDDFEMIDVPDSPPRIHQTSNERGSRKSKSKKQISTKSKAHITVDDVTRSDAMEVYLSNKNKGNNKKQDEKGKEEVAARASGWSIFGFGHKEMASSTFTIPITPDV